MMLNPFAPPSTHANYMIEVGGLEREVTLYSYPDYTYLIAGFGVLVVLASAVFIVRARRV
jgi:hypothetical protein